MIKRMVLIIKNYILIGFFLAVFELAQLIKSLLIVRLVADSSLGINLQTTN